MGILVAIISSVIIIASVIYLILTYRISVSDTAVRNASGNIDSALFESYHALKKLLPTMEEAGISISDIDIKSISINFGMTVAQQKFAYTQLKKIQVILSDIINSNDKYKDNNTLTSALSAFTDSDEVIKNAADAYDETVERFNIVVASFPAKQMAARKNKYAKTYFDIDTVRQSMNEQII